MSTVINAIGATPLAVLDGGTGGNTSTGTVALVFSGSPTLVTPTIGAATATSIAFSPTTEGIVGTTTNDTASSPYVGRDLTANVNSAITFSTGVAKDLLSMSLGDSDWDINGILHLNSTGTITSLQVWANTASATLPSDPVLTSIISPAAGTICSTVIPYLRITQSSTTTIYLSAICTGTGTLTCTGTIYARKAR